MAHFNYRARSQPQPQQKTPRKICFLPQVFLRLQQSHSLLQSEVSSERPKIISGFIFAQRSRPRIGTTLRIFSEFKSQRDTIFGFSSDPTKCVSTYTVSNHDDSNEWRNHCLGGRGDCDISSCLGLFGVLFKPAGIVGREFLSLLPMLWITAKTTTRGFNG